MIDYDEKAKEIYEQNKAVGWWDDLNPCIYQKLQLVSTEIAEATEGERKNIMDDHLPHRKMGEVELADALIRVLDIGGRYGWPYDRWMNVSPSFSDPALSIAGKHLFINSCIIDLMHNLPRPLAGLHGYVPSSYYTRLINSIVATAKHQGYDIEAAMGEKLEYNKQRADHKLENRAREHGKKF